MTYEKNLIQGLITKEEINSKKTTPQIASPKGINDPFVPIPKKFQIATLPCIIKFRENGYLDEEGCWKWAKKKKDPRKFSNKDERKTKEIIEKYSKKEWQYILKETSKERSNHHFHKLTELNKTVQKRAEMLNLDDLEGWFRFKSGNKWRLWGIVKENTFYVIWVDREHNFYKTKR